MSVANELRSIMGSKDTLMTEDVVKWARQNTDSALHKSLDWDDHEAAEKWRNWQVRRLIAIHITDQQGTRQLVSLSIDRARDGGGYRRLEDVVKAQDLREILLNDALNELDRIRKKYETVKELATVWDETDKIKIRKSRRLRKSEQPQQQAQVA